MVPAGFGWSVGDIIKLIEVSVVLYQAFNDARKSSSRQFQLLTDEFGRFHTCLELLRDVLLEHNKKLYFGHDQFRATLRECEAFLEKYSVLGERRPSIAKFFRTIGWTAEEENTISRLRTAVHGHAHVLGLYIGYMTLSVYFYSFCKGIHTDFYRQTSLEGSASNKTIQANTEETLNELRRLRTQPSVPFMRFPTQELEGIVAKDSGAGGTADSVVTSKLELVAKELDGFSQLLSRERDSLYSRSQADDGVVGLISVEDEAESTDKFVMQLQTMLQAMHQEVERELERVRNGSKREFNQYFSRRTTYDSGFSDIADLPVGPNSRYNLAISSSPTPSALSGFPGRPPGLSSDTDIPSPTFGTRQGPQRCRPSSSPMYSPFSDSSWSNRADTGTNTAVTSPIESTPGCAPDICTRPPSIRLPPAAADWSVFCNDAKVICKGWQNPWPCKISYCRRMTDGGLSLRAEWAKELYLHHDLPTTGINIPHTSHTDANPSAKNVVTFKEPRGHKLRAVIGEEKLTEEEPRYTLQNAADHKAFQELIYGCNLEKSWNIVSVKSDSEKESVFQTLRLWRDACTQGLLILFYANHRKRFPKTYIHEPKTSFIDKLEEKRGQLVRLSFLDRKADTKPGRPASVSSIPFSVTSGQSGQTSAQKAPRLQWIDIEFADLEDKREFVRLWQG